MSLPLTLRHQHYLKSSWIEPHSRTAWVVCTLRFPIGPNCPHLGHRVRKAAEIFRVVRNRNCSHLIPTKIHSFNTQLVRLDDVFISHKSRKTTFLISAIISAGSRLEVVFIDHVNRNDLGLTCSSFCVPPPPTLQKQPVRKHTYLTVPTITNTSLTALTDNLTFHYTSPYQFEKNQKKIWWVDYHINLPYWR